MEEEGEEDEVEEEQEKGTGDEVAEIVGGFLSEGGEEEEALETNREKRQRIAVASSPQAPIK